VKLRCVTTQKNKDFIYMNITAGALNLSCRCIIWNVHWNCLCLPSKGKFGNNTWDHTCRHMVCDVGRYFDPWQIQTI